MKTVVGFLSRAHGYEVLTSLIDSPKYNLLKVYTHRLKPKSQDPSRSEREDYSKFVKACNNNIPLISIDNKNEQVIDVPDCDYIVEVSWRYLIPSEITKKAKIGAFGIHRGKLPDYAGAQPIKQALLNNEKEIIITAHYLADVIDAGNVITSISHPVNYDKSRSFEDNIQRLRDEITPHFSKVTMTAFEILERKNIQ